VFELLRFGSDLLIEEDDDDENEDEDDDDKDEFETACSIFVNEIIVGLHNGSFGLFITFNLLDAESLKKFILLTLC
jgi:hypothetical protein